jgi:hypothetical protein
MEGEVKHEKNAVVAYLYKPRFARLARKNLVGIKLSEQKIKEMQLT